MKSYSLKIWNKVSDSLLDEQFGLPSIKVEDMIAGLVKGNVEIFNKLWDSLENLGAAEIESKNLLIEFAIDLDSSDNSDNLKVPVSGSDNWGSLINKEVRVPLNRTLTHLGLVSWLNAEKSKGNIDTDLDIDLICESLLDKFDCTIMRTGGKGFYINRIYDSVNADFRTVSVEFYGAEFSLKHISK